VKLLTIRVSTPTFTAHNNPRRAFSYPFTTIIFSSFLTMKYLLLVPLITLFPLSLWAQQNIIFTEPFRQWPGIKNVIVGPNAGGMSLGHNEKLTGRENTLIGYSAGDGMTSGSNNIFIGSESGYSNTTGHYNTFLGNQAGYSSTTGYYNTFLGSGSGYSNTTGEFNSFVGTGSGHDNTTGNHNAFMGSSAGYHNTTGNYNAFVGPNAGFNNTVASHNAFMGPYAGYWNSSGHTNAFMGPYTGYWNSSGYRNAFMGAHAGFSNTGGHSNAFVGTSAGYNNIMGSSNTFTGYQAGFKNTSGSSNSFMGHQSGFQNTSGYSNVAIGVTAGFNNLTGHNGVAIGDSAACYSMASGNLSVGSKAGLTNYFGSGNTFLGNKADVMPGKTALTNAAAIGTNARVGISNAIVLGDTILKTNVGIGLTAPVFPLDVRGTINIRNQGALKFSSRVQLQADDTEFLALTASEPGLIGLRLAHLNSAAPASGSADRFLSVDEQGRVGLYKPRIDAALVQLTVSRSADWADYVFAPDYQLAPLESVESYVKTNRHLPGVPSTEEVMRDGLNVGQINVKLLEKIEELTLYLIEQQKELNDLHQQVRCLIRDRK